jgi:hypothetical protein
MISLPVAAPAMRHIVHPAESNGERRGAARRISRRATRSHNWKDFPVSQTTVKGTNFEASILRAMAALEVAASCLEDAADAAEEADAEALFPERDDDPIDGFTGSANLLRMMYGCLECDLMPVNLRKIESLRNTIEEAIGID